MTAAPAAGVAGVAASLPAAAQEPEAMAMARTAMDCTPPFRDTPLRDLAAAKGLQIGSAMLVERIDPKHKAYAPNYLDLVTRECQIVSTENDFKIHRLVNLAQDGAPKPQIRWAGVDRFVKTFRDRDVAVHGHTLVWNRFFDRNFFRTLSAPDGRLFMEWYIEAVMGRFAGEVGSWDVVNEPTVPGEWPAKAYRTGPYFDAFGMDYITQAYKRARATDPSAKLVLNEFGFDWGSRWTNALRENFLRILDHALDGGAPIDAVGFQSHLMLHDRLAQDRFEAFVEQVRARGVEIMITELDVDEQPTTDPIEERDARMAAFVEDYLAPLVTNYEVKTIITWGLSDLHTYDYRDQTRQFAAAEFRPRPSWYDTDLRPKPVRDRVAALLARA